MNNDYYCTVYIQSSPVDQLTKNELQAFIRLDQLVNFCLDMTEINI